MNSPAMRAALAGLFAMAAAMGIGRFVYTPVLPHMLESGALTASQAGTVAGVNFLGYLIGALAASSRRFAARRSTWFFFALAVSVATTAAMSVTTGLVEMLWFRFLSGVASAFSMIFITALVMARLAHESRPGLIVLHFGGVGFGIAGSAMLVSVLAASGSHWREQWLFAGVAALVAWIAVRLLLPKALSETSTVQSSAHSTHLPAGLAWLIASYGLFGFGYVITATFINAMAKSVPALAPVEPWVWIVVGLAGAPSAWLWNRFAARTSIMFAYCAACIAEAVGVMASVTLQVPLVLIMSAILLGGTFMAITMLGLAQARTMAPHNAAAVIAYMTASFGLGQMIGPVVAGFLFEHSGSLWSASLLASAVLVLSVISTLPMYRLARSPQSSM
ncbi:MAG: YbfB/YjiJ family MFS transporter [Rhizobiaceae bacterium]